MANCAPGKTARRHEQRIARGGNRFPNSLKQPQVKGRWGSSLGRDDGDLAGMLRTAILWNKFPWTQKAAGLRRDMTLFASGGGKVVIRCESSTQRFSCGNGCGK